MNDHVEKNIVRELKRFENFSDGSGLPRGKGDWLSFRWGEESYPTGQIAAIPYQLTMFHGLGEEKAREHFTDGRYMMDEIEPDEFINSITIEGKPVQGDGNRINVTVMYTVVQVNLDVRRNRNIFQNFSFDAVHDEEDLEKMATWIRKVFLNRPKFNKASEISFFHARKISEANMGDNLGSSATIELEADVIDLLKTGNYNITLGKNPLSLKQNDFKQPSEFLDRRGPFYNWGAQPERKG